VRISQYLICNINLSFAWWHPGLKPKCASIKETVGEAKLRNGLQDVSDTIAIEVRVGWSTDLPRKGQKPLPFPVHPVRTWGPPVCQSVGTAGFFLEVKFDPWCSSSTEVKNEWTFTSIPLIRLHGAGREKCNRSLSHCLIIILMCDTESLNKVRDRPTYINIPTCEINLWILSD
jgi:hypothetical protein